MPLYDALKNLMKSRADYVSVNMSRFIAMDSEDPSVDCLALAKALGVPATRIDRDRYRAAYWLPSEAASGECRAYSRAPHEEGARISVCFFDHLDL
jgi:hypothetical protein